MYNRTSLQQFGNPTPLRLHENFILMNHAFRSKFACRVHLKDSFAIYNITNQAGIISFWQQQHPYPDRVRVKKSSGNFITSHLDCREYVSRIRNKADDTVGAVTHSNLCKASVFKLWTCKFDSRFSLFHFWHSPNAVDNNDPILWAGRIENIDSAILCESKYVTRV